ncbi:RING-H2 finger containing membrane associated protein [Cryptosporidium ryanae]|uniref:RING-H2 finger containing membrane associated protein n=1 Tax=Cryptosporidium ryanae TaxID=515981 RepID=UPI00351A5DA8|nr:RING-H2 finger containing membrane associated protein [Cryptosporidium ryanae]
MEGPSIPEENTSRTSLFDNFNGFEIYVQNISMGINQRNLIIYIILFFFIIFIINFENKFDNYNSIINKPIYSSSLFYFGEFEMNINSNSLNQNVYENDVDPIRDSTIIIKGPSKWQFDWSKSDIKSNTAWLSLKLQLENNNKEFNFEFEKVINVNDPNLYMIGVMQKDPLVEILISNVDYCSIEIDISNDKHIWNKLFPVNNKGMFKFRGSSFDEKGALHKTHIEYILKSKNCNFSALIKGNPFSTSLFRLNVVHFSFLYNLKVLMEIRGGLTQFAHINLPTNGQSYLTNISIATVLFQMIIDVFEGSFLLFFTIIVPSLFFSSFTLMVLFKWMHITFIQIRFLYLIWKSNYLNNVAFNDIQNLTTQFYKKLYLFLFGVLLIFLSISKLCNSSLYLKNDEISQKNMITNIIQSVPYYLYVSLFFYLLPQIINDSHRHLLIPRSHSLPLHPHYIVTSLIGKAFFPIYVWGYSNSIFNDPVLYQFTKIIPINTKYIPSLSFTIFIIITFQALLYFLQYQFGPKCLIPKFLRPKPYNYFRLANIGGKFEDTNTETDISIKESTSDTKKDSLNIIDSSIREHYSSDPSIIFSEIELTNYGEKSTIYMKQCVICMANIIVLNNFESEMCGVCTPCDHIFHQKCLKQWMDIKLECPTCRRIIPPFEPSL